MERTIRVTGKGNLRLKPDTTRLFITLKGTEKEYHEAVQRSAEDTGTLKDVLEKLGFARDSLKTLSFSVDPEYENRKGRNGDYQRHFVGYTFTHGMKLEFPSDRDLLGRTLYALAHAGMNPEFRISFTVSDPETAKNELLEKAVADAVAKAQVLAGAAGLKLGEIRCLDYSWGEVDFEVRPAFDMRTESISTGICENVCDLDIEPDDIRVSDTVTVVWEIM